MNLINFESTALIRAVQIISLTVLLQSCATPSAITIDPKNIEAPAQWQSLNAGLNTSPTFINDFDEWLSGFDDIQLTNTVHKALNYNRDLKAEYISLKLYKEELKVSEADNFPEVSLGVNSTREKSVNNGDDSSLQSKSNISLSIGYEVDVWGKLSAQQQQSTLNYASAKASFNQQQIDIVTTVIKQWYNIVEANKLLELYTERSINLDKNLSMIESSYQLGLGESLDVYLTQNSLNSELSRVAEQEQNVKVEIRTLELLLGGYPSGVLEKNTELLIPNSKVFASIPSSLLTQRQDLKASWFELLALDAGLAVAHKQRFPTFSLTASTSDSSPELSNLLNGNVLAWSLIGNAVAPIFNGGKLASLEEQARLKVIQQEHYYLTAVYSAFAEVENALSNHTALLKRLKLLEQAEINALTAQTLSFDQYMRGLVTYTTVLEAERRAFDAQTSLIQVKNTLIQNRVDTFLALGGVLNSDHLSQIVQRTNEQEQ